MSIADALVHLDDALDALTIEGWRSETGEPGSFERVPQIECTLAVELERVDAALGPRGQSIFAIIAERIKQAVIAVAAAKQSLTEAP